MTAIRGQAKLEKRITALVEHLIDLMELHWLEIQIRFDQANGPDSPVCGTQCDWQYRRAVMSWNLPEACSLQDDELELVAIHELCHPLIDPVWDAHPEKDSEPVKKVGELSVENVARVVQALLKGNE